MRDERRSLRGAALALSMALAAAWPGNAAPIAGKQPRPEPSAPTASAASDAAIERATALHDQGKFDDAIEILRGVVEREPHNVAALYELAHSLKESGKPAECVPLAERALREPDGSRALVLVLLGNCIDLAGDPRAAAKLFADASREFPDDAAIAYNAGVVAFRLQDFAAGLAYGKRAAQLRPGHASAHFLLLMNSMASGQRFPALLSGLRFLSLDPGSARAREIATLTRHALEAGVARDEHGKIQVEIGSEKKGSEGDFTGLELIVGMLTTNALAQVDKVPEAERVAGIVAGLVEFLAVDHSAKMGPSFVLDEYRTLWSDLAEAKVTTAFGIHVFQSLDLAGRDAWRSAHAEEMKRLEVVLAAHAR
jgi:Tfp pilus assembly protein PilF